MKLLATLLCALLLACAPLATSPIPHQSILSDQQLQAATVRLSAGGNHGSGVMIGSHTILTAKHVVMDDNGLALSELTVKFHDGHKASAKVLWNSDVDLSIVLLDSAEPPQPFLPVRCTRPSAGERIETIGNPLNFQWAESRGRVASDFSHEGYTVLDITVAPGSSGGPVFDSSGQVLGVVSAMAVAPIGPLPEVVRYTLMTPVKPLCELHAPNRPPSDH